MAKLKITETQIDNYNETNNQLQKFDEGLNIICGDNEAGKSTMMEFIKNIFTKKSSSAKGYIKCELDGESFNLISGDSKKIKTNEQYISNLSPHEFQTGFIINLDDIMFAKKANAEELINVIKDSSGNAINQKQDEYYDYIYGGKKQEFSLTPKNSLSTNFKKQFDKLKELDSKIKELQTKEADYNKLLQSLENLDKEISLTDKKIEYSEILLNKKNLIKECESIKLNKNLIDKKSDFDNLREKNSIFNSQKQRFEKLSQEIEQNKTNLETIIKELSRLDVLAGENIENIEISSDDYRFGKELIEKDNNIDFEKTNLEQKISDIEKNISQTEFEIQSIENQLAIIGIEDIDIYNTDKEMLGSFIKRYSELLDKSRLKENRPQSKWYSETYALIFGAILCGSIGTLILCWNTPFKLPLFALILCAIAGLITTFMHNKNGKNSLNDEINKIGLEIIKLSKKYGFMFESAENFVVKGNVFYQKMNDNSSEYKHIETDLLKERIRLEKEKQELANKQELLSQINDKKDRLNNEKTEFLNKIKISSLDNFESVYEQLKEIKSIRKRLQEQQEEIEAINKLHTEIVDNLNKFTEETNLNDYKKYNKYDDISIVINEIETVLQENLTNQTKLKDIETKIAEDDSKLENYDNFKEFENTDETSLENLKSAQKIKTDERGRLRQQKEDLEMVSNLINLKTEKKIELENIKNSISKLIQKEVIYNLIKSAKEKFNQTQPNLVCAKKYFSKITNGKYSDIDFETKTISGKEIGEKDWDNLSRGTKEQLYLALRLGYANNYSKDIQGNPNGKPNLPIIIDDAFVNFDPTRTTAIISCLSEFAKNNQILYFTCHSQAIKNILEQNKIKHNYINI